MSELTVSKALERRRATRHFDPSRPLDEALLKRILSLATQAPSGFNLQPWRFLVVRSTRNREKLRACAYGQAKITEAPVAVIVLGHKQPHLSHLDAIVDTQVRLGVLTPEQAAEWKGRARAGMGRQQNLTLWATRSTMLAAMALMLAAESLGVQSAPMEGFDEEKVRAAFGVPDDHAVCCLVCLGHAASTKPFPGRLGLNDVCHEEHFGQPWTLGEEEGPS
jgi:nitroreductase